MGYGRWKSVLLEGGRGREGPSPCRPPPAPSAPHPCLESGAWESHTSRRGELGKPPCGEISGDLLPVAYRPVPLTPCPDAGDRPGSEDKSWRSALPKGRRARKAARRGKRRGACPRLSDSPYPPVPAPGIGLGARTRAGNPHCRKGGQPGKSPGGGRGGGLALAYRPVPLAPCLGAGDGSGARTRAGNPHCRKDGEPEKSLCGGTSGGLAPACRTVPLTPCPGAGDGSGARTRAGNLHCRKGEEPGKDLFPPPNSARLLASASEVDRELRWRAGKRGSLLSFSPYPPASALPIAPLPSARRANTGFPLAPLPGAGVFGGAVRRRAAAVLSPPDSPPTVRLLRRAGGGGPAPPAPACSGTGTPLPGTTGRFRPAFPGTMEKRGPRGEAPARAPSPVPGPLSPPVPRRATKSARPARSPDRRSSLTCGI